MYLTSTYDACLTSDVSGSLCGAHSGHSGSESQNVGSLSVDRGEGEGEDEGASIVSVGSVGIGSAIWRDHCFYDIRAKLEECSCFQSSSCFFSIMTK